MTIDSPLCIVPPNKRKIWTDPQRFWTRDPGNCNLGNDVSGFDFIKSLQINQEKFKNLVLENKVPPIGGSGPMSNVDGRLKKTSFYNYLSKVKSNPHHRHQTYAAQRQNGTYTNPNTQSDILKIVRINNIPAFLTCIEKNTDSNLTPPSPVPPPIPPPPVPGPGVNLVTGVPRFQIPDPWPPFPTLPAGWYTGVGISRDTYKKILSVNGLTGTNTDASALKGYRFTVDYLPSVTPVPPLLWTLGGKISVIPFPPPSLPPVWLELTTGGKGNDAPLGLGKSACDNGVRTCYTLIFYPPTIPILPTPPNIGPITVDQIAFYAVEPSPVQPPFILQILLSDYLKILSMNKVNDASQLTAYRFKGSKNDNLEWMLNGTMRPGGEGLLGQTIKLGVTSGPKVEAKPDGAPYTLTFYPRLS